MLALEYDKSVDENKEAMLEVIKGVTSISVTYAARDSVFDGVQIKRRLSCPAGKRYSARSRSLNRRLNI